MRLQVKIADKYDVTVNLAIILRSIENLDEKYLFGSHL